MYNDIYSINNIYIYFIYNYIHKIYYFMIIINKHC